MKAMSENSMWKTIRAINAPTPADGRVESTVSGWM